MRLTTRAIVTAAVLLAAAPITLAAQAGTLVVVNKGPSTVNLVDLATGDLVETLPTGTGPHEVVTAADGALAVVTDYGARTAGGSLTVIDVPARAVARTIDLGNYRRPHGIAFLPGDSLVAVTSEAANAVVLVRVSDGEIVQTISTEAGGSHMLAVVEDGSRIYTSNGRDDSVSELDVAAGRLTRIFDVPPGPEAITVTADGNEVWVGSNEDGTVSVIDTRTGDIETVASGFGWPYRILITPDNRLALIPDLRSHELRVLDRATRRELHRFSFPSGGPQGITVAPDGNTVYHSMSQQGRVAVIDLDRMEVTGYIETSPAPDGVAVGR